MLKKMLDFRTADPKNSILVKEGFNFNRGE